MSSFTSGVVLVVDLKMNVNITGSTDLAALIKKAISTISHIAGPLVEEAEAIRAASMEIVPVDQGILRASAMEVGINVEERPTGVSVSFGYGGAAASYALKQHETPPGIFTHAPGKTWKYLERPTMEAVNGMADRLAVKMRARIEESLR